MHLSQFAFLVLILALAEQRIAELRLSRDNEAWMRLRGGREYGSQHFRWMQAMHILWFPSMALESFFATPTLPLTVIGAVLLLAGQLLRAAAIRTLGSRWSVRIYSLPDHAPVSHGIYKYLRHPNYVGVALELAGAPLIYGGWMTAVVFSVLNAALMAVRIPAEVRALHGR
ncbi:MAG: hypothetical protein K1X75_17165 [Leptospirales bacterium]|nr:hypothetical protein [Leptospirales bacterium]